MNYVLPSRTLYIKFLFLIFQSVISKVILIKNLKVNEMAQQLLAMQTWQPEFNPWNPGKMEGQKHIS